MLTLELCESDFVRLFDEYNRSEQFSIPARRKLFQYLDQLSDDIGEDIKIDVIAICCDYVESTIKEALENYNLESLDDLRDHTQVIEIDDETIIYVNYQELSA